jgi:cytochrome c oxidase subunit IV
MAHDTVISATAEHEGTIHHHGVSHVTSVKLLLTVWAALMVGTVLTVAVSYANLGPYALYVALVVAFIKASLVALYFMHLRYDRPFNAIVFVGCLILVTLFISFSMSDSHAYRQTVIGGQAPKVSLQNLSEHEKGETPKPGAEAPK